MELTAAHLKTAHTWPWAKDGLMRVVRRGLSIGRHYLVSSIGRRSSEQVAIFGAEIMSQTLEILRDFPS